MRYRPKGKRNITRRSRPNQAAQLAAERGLPYRTITDPSGAQRGEVNVGSEWVGAWGWFREVAPTPQYRPKSKRDLTNLFKGVAPTPQQGYTKKPIRSPHRVSKLSSRVIRRIKGRQVKR